MVLVPSDITGLIGWWKADDLALANGATVNPWGSNGTYGPDLDETAGTAPTLDTSVAINGIPGVRFASTRTLRDTTSGTLTGFTNGVGGATLIVVAKLDSTPTTARAATIATGTAGASASRYVLSCLSGIPQFFSRRIDGVGGATTNGVSSIGTSAAHVLAGTIDYATTTQRLYVDGAEVASSTSALTAGTTSTDSTGVAIGSHPGNAVEGWPGPLYEVILLDHAATSAENEGLHGYVQARFTVTVANYVAIHPASVAALASVLSPTPSAGTGVVITPSVVTASTAVGAPTVTVGEPEPEPDTTRRSALAASGFSIAPTFHLT